MRTKSAIFSILVIIFLCGPLIMLGAQRLSVDIPEWLQPESAKYLSGGWAKTNVRPLLNTEGFSSGKLQEAIEEKMGNLIPAKATVLLDYSKLQRGAIRVSAGFFGFDCWPSFYGSSVLYQDDRNALSAKPYKSTASMIEQIREFGTGFAQIAERFPDKTFCVIVADDSTTSIANPGHELSEGCLSTEEVNGLLQNACANLSNVRFVDAWYNDPTEYYQYFYTTDHHWNGWGAIDAYKRAIDTLSEVLGKDVDGEVFLAPLGNLDEQKNLDWIDEHGYYARNALMLVNEAANEPALPAGSYEVAEGIAPAAIDANGPSVMAQVGPIAEYDFYQTWYGSWVDSVVNNPAAVCPDQETLIICDSFGTAFKWVASTGFGRVTSLYDLHDSRTDTEPLCDTLEGSNANVVFLIARSASYQKVLDRFPDYLNLP